MPAARSHRIAILPGDGIGPEVMAEALKVLAIVQERFGFTCDLLDCAIGGAAIDRCGEPLPEETWEACQRADAVLLGSVGGPRWDHLPLERRPETGGLLSLRRRLRLFANLRPARLYPELKPFSPLALRGPEREFDILTVRELSSGVYFGEPRFLGEEEALDSMRYRRREIERIGHVAFAAARLRRGRVTSVDKANVLHTSMLWRRTISRLAREYPDVDLRHLHVDNAAMQLILDPFQFDVILTENLFGDILSDETAALCGSLGLLPSASLGGRVHLFEPAGGSAPDIAGRGIANPIAQVLSLALMLEHALGEIKAAAAIAAAVRRVIASGLRTRDIAGPGERAIPTREMGDAIARALESDRGQP